MEVKVGEKNTTEEEIDKDEIDRETQTRQDAI